MNAYHSCVVEIKKEDSSCSFSFFGKSHFDSVNGSLYSYIPVSFRHDLPDCKLMAMSEGDLVNLVRENQKKRFHNATKTE